MTRFADQLFEDLMREHGQALEDARPAAHGGRRVTSRRAMLAGGSALAAAGVIVGAVAAGSGTAVPPIAGSRLPVASPHQAYAVTRNPDGTITLAVYHKSGIAAANARLRQMGEDQVVVVPVEAGCPPLAPPVVADLGQTITASGSVSGGSVIVTATGIPAGDILVVGVQTSGATTSMVGAISSPPAPACISFGPAAPGGGSATQGHGVHVARTEA